VGLTFLIKTTYTGVTALCHLVSAKINSGEINPKAKPDLRSAESFLEVSFCLH